MRHRPLSKPPAKKGSCGGGGSSSGAAALKYKSSASASTPAIASAELPVGCPGCWRRACDTNFTLKRNRRRCGGERGMGCRCSHPLSAEAHTLEEDLSLAAASSRYHLTTGRVALARPKLIEHRANDAVGDRRGARLSHHFPRDFRHTGGSSHGACCDAKDSTSRDAREAVSRKAK
jgi:hypothetical protein